MEKFKYKDIDKQITDALKNHVKKFGYKKIDFYAYRKYKDYFISICFDSGDSAVTACAYIKPFFIDDVFWDVFDISSNKERPMSLRANGAFTIHGIVPVEKSGEIKESLDEIDSIVQNLLEEIDAECIRFIDDLGDDVDNYIAVAQKLERDISLQKMLFHIKNNRLEEALILAKEELEKGHHGGYGTGDKNIYEFVVDYCNKRLAPQPPKVKAITTTDERLKTYRFNNSWFIDIPYSWSGGIDEDDEGYLFYPPGSDLTIRITDFYTNGTADVLKASYYESIPEGSKPYELGFSLDSFDSFAYETDHYEDGFKVHRLMIGCCKDGLLISVNIYALNRDECIDVLKYIKTIKSTEKPKKRKFSLLGKIIGRT